jgi:uncharacterized RDD family membrane protein YckC
MAELRGPIYDKSSFAGAIRRTFALLIDAVILVTTLFSAHELLWRFSDHLTDHEYYQRADAIWTLWWIGCVAYAIGLRLSTRGTLGYRVMRIEFVYMLGEKPSLLVRLHRAIVGVALISICRWDHVWILFDERRQAWHDKITGFYVVKRGARPIGERQMVRRVIHFMALSFIVWEPRDATVPPSESQGIGGVERADNALP